MAHMGSAAAHRLAQRGKRVLGLEKFTAVQTRGSSRGGSRITPDSGTITGSRASVEQFGLKHELLDAPQLRERFPALRPTPDEVALYEPCAGFVVPENAVRAHRDLADRAGAERRFEEPVARWEDVVCPGPWAPELLADLDIPFEIERQVQYHFAPTENFRDHPVYIWDREGSQFYGFPEIDAAVKVAFHTGGQICTPETIDRTVHAHEVETVAAATRPVMPGLAGQFQRAVTCMYTNTADGHFVVAKHPGRDNVTVACGFSGHGFKFVPVVGEILADLTIDGATRHPIALFDPARLRGGA